MNANPNTPPPIDPGQTAALALDQIKAFALRYEVAPPPTNQAVAIAEEIRKAIKLLYLPGDVVEVRAFAPAGVRCVGRYPVGWELVRAIEREDQLGRDVYYVLNPTNLPPVQIASQQSGTRETDVKRRRHFLLDFDPIRQNKLATAQQHKLAIDQATAAKNFLYAAFPNWQIVQASSGNGCHLLVAVDLPNDAESKDIVHRTQRVVSGLYSTQEVECECFADAARLVRAYGTENKKGTETSENKRRRSCVLAEEQTANGNRVPATLEQLKAFLAKYEKSEAAPQQPVAIQVTDRAGDIGSFTLELLEDLLEKWSRANAWFEFVRGKTSYGPGFHITCPGADGWPDGERHTEPSNGLTSTTAVWVSEKGHPNFACKRSHCDHGAAHGRKGWKDLVAVLDKGEQRSVLCGTTILGSSSDAATKKFLAEAGATARRVELKFVKPRVVGGDYDFVLNPLAGETDGLFPRGEVSLIAASSGGGKTTLMMMLLEDQKAGRTIFKHTTNGLPYLLALEDRSEASLRRTFLRMRLDIESTPYRLLDREGKSLAQAIADLLDTTDSTPAVVFIEGLDLATEDAGKMESVSRTLKDLLQVAQHYHVAIIGSVGCPKMKPKDRYASLRDTVFGSAAWARKVETIMTLQKQEGRDTDEKTVLTILPRNAKHEVYTLEFSHGRLVEAPPEAKIEKEGDDSFTMEHWAQTQKEPFTRAGFALRFPASETTIRRRLEKMVALKIVEQGRVTRKGVSVVEYTPLPVNIGIQ